MRHGLPPDRPLRVVQITDTHLFEDPRGCLLALETQGSRDRVLAQLRATRRPVDLILATGDLVHDGSVGAYERLGATLAALETPTYCLPGNHDAPDLLAKHLNFGSVHSVGGVRAGDWAFVFLNTCIPDSPNGHLDDQEFAHLITNLERHPSHPTLVCLHHNPLPMGSTWIDRMQIDNGARLLALLDTFPQVRGVLWGHVHQAFDGQRGAMKLLATPSTCVQFLPFSSGFDLDPAPPGYRWLDLWPDGRIDTGVERLTDWLGYPSTQAKGY